MVNKDLKFELIELLSQWGRESNENNHLVELYGESDNTAEG